MVRGEENGGRLVYMYEPRSTFVSISCCHIHVYNNLLLICIIIGTIPSLQGVLIVPLALGLLTLFMMFYWKTICVCLAVSDFQLPLTWHLFWSIVYWKCFSPSEGNTVGLFTYFWKEPIEIHVYGNGKKLLQTFNVKNRKSSFEWLLYWNFEF